MFCSSCGNELQREGLKYCNRCGAKTSMEPEKIAAASESGKTLQVLSSAIGAVGVFGIIGLIVLISRLLRKDHIEPEAFLLVVIFSAVIFCIIFLLMRQISILSGKKLFRAAKESETGMRENLLWGGNTAQLEPPRQPIGSVIDHTTRNFEENIEESFAKKPKN